MPKQILFYSEVHPYSAVEFLTKLDEAAGEDVELCISSNGGYTDYAMGMVEKWQSYQGNKKVVVHGMAHSVMGIFLCFVTNASALETASIVLHRAHFPAYYEESSYFTEDDKNQLAMWNAFARKSFEAKIDAKKFQELKGISIKEIFTSEKVIDVRLTAKEAKQVGLIDSVIKLTPEVKAELAGHMSLHVDNGYQRMVAIVTEEEKPSTENKPKETIIPKNKVMTAEEFKAAHPAEYAKAVAAGVAQERDRVCAAMVYNDVDPEGVMAIVKSGDEMSRTQMAEFNRKISSQAIVAKVKKDSKEDVETPEAEEKEVPEGEKKKAAFTKLLNEKLGIKGEA